MATNGNLKGLHSFSSSQPIAIIKRDFVYVEIYTSLDKLFPDTLCCLLGLRISRHTQIALLFTTRNQSRDIKLAKNQKEKETKSLDLWSKTTLQHQKNNNSVNKPTLASSCFSTTSYMSNQSFFVKDLTSQEMEHNTYSCSARRIHSHWFLQSASVKQTLLILIIYQHSIQLLLRTEHRKPWSCGGPVKLEKKYHMSKSQCTYKNSLGIYWTSC